uniref:Uncharacterized protein n=1 Tax=Arundo donax TaxID=35708 RepID=A0A0A9DSN0_ARUDO
MPKPPYWIGRHTRCQETRQLPPFACSCPFQRNPHLPLSIALRTHLGRSIEII